MRHLYCYEATQEVTYMCTVLREEIAYTMWNIGAATIADLKPEMVGPAGAWVGANRPVYAREW